MIVEEFEEIVTLLLFVPNDITSDYEVHETVSLTFSLFDV